MPNKQVVSSNTQQATKTTHQPDGTVVEEITTTITEKYADGSTGIRTQVQTKTTTPGGGGGTNAPSKETPKNSKAEKVRSSISSISKLRRCRVFKELFAQVPVTTDRKWIHESLEEHNILRAKHGAPPLTINEDLCKISQAWVNYLAAKLGKMQHSTCGFGENIYWSTEMIDGRHPVRQWYSEIKDYNFNKLEGQKGTGHFTQVIWKGTQEMGVALAVGAQGKFVVANYYPPGNFVGKYAEHIQRAKS